MSVHTGCQIGYMQVETISSTDPLQGLWGLYVALGSSQFRACRVYRISSLSFRIQGLSTLRVFNLGYRILGFVHFQVKTLNLVWPHITPTKTIGSSLQVPTRAESQILQH